MVIPSGENFLFILTQVILFLAIVSFLLVIVVLILRLIDHYENKRKIKFLAEWEKDFYEYLGSPEDPTKLLAEVKKSQFKFLLMVLRDLFSALDGKDLESLKRIINETAVYDFLLADLKSKSTRRIIRAAYFFGASNNQNVKALLFGHLYSKKTDVFIFCARALARINALEYATAILHAARYQRDLSTDILISILLEYKSEVCNYLLDRIGFEDDYYKQVSIQIFRFHGFREAAGIVLKIFQTSTNKKLLIECIKYSGTIECIDAIPHLWEHFEYPDIEVKTAAIEALAKIGGTDLAPIFVQRLYEESYEVNIAAAEALLDLGENGIKLLKVVAKSNADSKAASIAKMVLSENFIEIDDE
ncbi:MAG: HEAT repeat domain-containing protein [Ignavibacterium sp.]|nr:HEAT repeat domain-containing protein [Ignavibacterium sp.]